MGDGGGWASASQGLRSNWETTIDQSAVCRFSPRLHQSIIHLFFRTADNHSESRWFLSIVLTVNLCSIRIFKSYHGS